MRGKEGKEEEMRSGRIGKHPLCQGEVRRADWRITEEESDGVGGVEMDPSFQSLTSNCGPMYIITLSLEPPNTWFYPLFPVSGVLVLLSWHS